MWERTDVVGGGEHRFGGIGVEEQVWRDRYKRTGVRVNRYGKQAVEKMKRNGDRTGERGGHGRGGKASGRVGR